MKKTKSTKTRKPTQAGSVASLSQTIKSMEQRLQYLEGQLASIQKEIAASMEKFPGQTPDAREGSKQSRIFRVMGKGRVGPLDLRDPDSARTRTEASIWNEFDHAYSEHGVAGLREFIALNKSEITEYVDQFGQSLLFRASRLKKSFEAAEVCKLLLDAGLPASGPPARYGRTPLMVMVMDRPQFHNKVAEVLKSSVNLQDDEGRTALTFAVEGAGLFGSRKGSIPIIMKLIELGADPFLQTKQGKTALDFAIKSNDTEQNTEVVSLMKKLMKRGNPAVRIGRL